VVFGLLALGGFGWSRLCVAEATTTAPVSTLTETSGGTAAAADAAAQMRSGGWSHHWRSATQGHPSGGHRTLEETRRLQQEAFGSSVYEEAGQPRFPAPPLAGGPEWRD
jgi:hypothetical protein